MKVIVSKGFLDCRGNVKVRTYSKDIDFEIREDEILDSVLENGDYSKCSRPCRGKTIRELVCGTGAPEVRGSAMDSVETDDIRGLRFVFSRFRDGKRMEWEDSDGR